MKVFKVIVISTVTLILLTLGGFYMNQELERQYMLEIVQSEEAKKVYEETIYNLDPEAFTDNGKILTYDIDMDSVKQNPMGGVHVNLIVNNDKSMIIRNILNLDDNGDLNNNGGDYAVELQKLLEE